MSIGKKIGMATTDNERYTLRFLGHVERWVLTHAAKASARGYPVIARARRGVGILATMK